MNIYDELGVTAYINANEWYRSQGGSRQERVVAQRVREVLLGAQK
jgi:hypothetical protein